MSFLSKFLNASILFSFDQSGYRRHSKNYKQETWNGKDQIAVITGGNAGIGFATAKGLLNHGVTVHILSRNQKRGKQALQTLKEHKKNAQVFLHVVDMSDEAAIKKWVLNDAPDHIDLLINNAGGMTEQLTYTKSGEELTWATHLIGHYLLTESLIKMDKLSSKARVITVSSGGMYLQKLDLKDLTWNKRSYNKYQAYANAKRAQVILTKIWHAKFGDKIRFSCMHPGWVATTGVKKSMPIFYRWLQNRLRSPEEGADTILWLALTETDYTGGEFWFDRTTVSPHRFQFTEESETDRKELEHLCLSKMDL